MPRAWRNSKGGDEHATSDVESKEKSTPQTRATRKIIIITLKVLSYLFQEWLCSTYTLGPCLPTWNIAWGWLMHPWMNTLFETTGEFSWYAFTKHDFWYMPTFGTYIMVELHAHQVYKQPFWHLDSISRSTMHTVTLLVVLGVAWAKCDCDQREEELLQSTIL